jgi:hypothetical protein
MWGQFLHIYYNEISEIIVNKSAIGLFMLTCKMALSISLIYIHTLILMLHCRFGGGEFPPMDNSNSHSNTLMMYI